MLPHGENREGKETDRHQERDKAKRGPTKRKSTNPGHRPLECGPPRNPASLPLIGVYSGDAVEARRKSIREEMEGGRKT